MDNRISKKEFLDKVSTSSGKPVSDVAFIYDAIISQIFEEVTNGNSVSLAGFGTFYLQKHKGHPVQFESEASSVIADYLVLKFSASKTSNKFVRELNVKKRGGKRK